MRADLDEPNLNSFMISQLRQHTTVPHGTRTKLWIRRQQPQLVSLHYPIEDATINDRSNELATFITYASTTCLPPSSAATTPSAH